MFSARKLIEQCYIKEGSKYDYAPFERLHYRSGTLPVVDKVFTLRLPDYGAVAVIVYSFAPAHLAARRKAIGALLPPKATRGEMMKFINANIRIISRVVVLPEFRGAGLASHLIANTIPLAAVPIVEAVAAMGRFSGFFTAAGMNCCNCPTTPREKRMRKALAAVGLRGKMWLDASLAAKHLTALPSMQRNEVEAEMSRFLGAYGNKRNLKQPNERMKIVLTKLSGKTAYFYHISQPFINKETKICPK